MFERTAQGLANLPIFLDIDLLLFVEGGKDVDANKANGLFADQGLDLHFWTSVWKKFKPKIRIGARGIGSKREVLELIDVVGPDCDSVLFCVDSDFDRIKKKLNKDPRVLYTFGYSWENDIWENSTVEHLMQITCPGIILNSKIRKEIKEIFSTLDRELDWMVKADYFLSKKDESFFSRKKHRWIKLNGNRVALDQKAAKAEYQEILKRHQLKRRPRITAALSVKAHCYGKLFDKLMYHSVVALSKESSIAPNKISIPLAQSIAIAHFAKSLNRKVAIGRHYSDQITRSANELKKIKKRLNYN